MSCKNLDMKKPPIILSGKKWNAIVNQVTRKEIATENAKKDSMYKEYLKNGSRDMMRNWPDIQKHLAHSGFNRHRQNRTEKDKKQEEEDSLYYKKIMENDVILKQKKISDAKKLIARSHQGPRELESASLFCEVLKGREIQLNIQQKMKNIELNRKACEIENMERQNIPWIAEEKERIDLAKIRNAKYRKELQTCVALRHKNNIDCTKQLVDAEKKVLKRMELQLKQQIIEENEAQRLKKLHLKEASLEAITMSNQRRARFKIENNIDDKINYISTNGKEKLSDLRKLKEKQFLMEKIKASEENVKNLNNLLLSKKKLNDLGFETIVKEKQKIYEISEEKKRKKEETAIQERKEYFASVLKKKQENDIKCQNELKWAVVNRIKNQEVNENFKREKIEFDLKRAAEIRTALLQQIEERKIFDKNERTLDQKCTVAHIYNEDKFFFEHAKKLLDNAQEKCRPVIPILKVIERYKKEHSLV